MQNFLNCFFSNSGDKSNSKCHLDGFPWPAGRPVGDKINNNNNNFMFVMNQAKTCLDN